MDTETLLWVRRYKSNAKQVEPKDYINMPKLCRTRDTSAYITMPEQSSDHCIQNHRKELRGLAKTNHIKRYKDNNHAPPNSLSGRGTHPRTRTLETGDCTTEQITKGTGTMCLRGRILGQRMGTYATTTLGRNKEQTTPRKVGERTDQKGVDGQLGHVGVQERRST